MSVSSALPSFLSKQFSGDWNPQSFLPFLFLSSVFPFHLRQGQKLAFPNPFLFLFCWGLEPNLFSGD